MSRRYMGDWQDWYDQLPPECQEILDEAYDRDPFLRLFLFVNSAAFLVALFAAGAVGLAIAIFFSP